MRKNKTPMPVRSPEERRKDFEEVAIGYTCKLAQSEAARCLNCPSKPCVSGCPVGIDIPAFIRAFREGDPEGAYAIISRASLLPAICGRVCPQETQCEARCVRGRNGEPVGIGRLERYVADLHGEKPIGDTPAHSSNGLKVAVVGSGPSGLACAGALARMGYAVTVYEALHEAGGVLIYGIPEFRLPKRIVHREIDELKRLGVEIMTNVVIGRTLTVDDLLESGYEAVFIGSGAGLPRFMGIDGEQLKGVFSANEFLTRSNLMKAYKNDAQTPLVRGGVIAVVGGGNVAMDAARTAVRLGAEKTYIVYRRSREELPARREEVEHAEEEGVEFLFLHNPVKILAYKNECDPRDQKNGWVKALRCVRMQLGEPDEKGRRRPVEIPGSEFNVPVDTVIMAIGTSPNPLIRQTTNGLEADNRGCLIVRDGSTATTKEGVFAGGDAVTGAATVILAMGAGKEAAREIDAYITAKKERA